MTRTHTYKQAALHIPPFHDELNRASGYQATSSRELDSANRQNEEWMLQLKNAE